MFTAGANIVCFLSVKKCSSGPNSIGTDFVVFAVSPLNLNLKARDEDGCVRDILLISTRCLVFIPGLLSRLDRPKAQRRLIYNGKFMATGSKMIFNGTCMATGPGTGTGSNMLLPFMATGSDMLLHVRRASSRTCTASPPHIRSLKHSADGLF
jgi:hypothetical protein